MASILHLQIRYATYWCMIFSFACKFHISKPQTLWYWGQVFQEMWVNTMDFIYLYMYYQNANTCFLNSSPPSVPYICQWIRSALVQRMACCLFGAKPFSKPMLVTKMQLKISSAKWQPFCPGGDELKNEEKLNLMRMFGSVLIIH